MINNRKSNQVVLTICVNGFYRRRRKTNQNEMYGRQALFIRPSVLVLLGNFLIKSSAGRIKRFSGGPVEKLLGRPLQIFAAVDESGRLLSKFVIVRLKKVFPPCIMRAVRVIETLVNQSQRHLIESLAILAQLSVCFQRR